jgi:UDP-N-acetylglucosamine--N-acetylmuramyl-(pentapeptide) pyrophosphoryl-undecaprenol N-acetylglucosamine transferase
MTGQALRVLAAAGGTGGHVVPAATLAGELDKLMPGTDFLFVGTGRPAEGAILDPLGFRRRNLKVRPLAGLRPLKAAAGLMSLAGSLIGAVSIVRDYRPDVCLAFGGHVCGPVGLAAKIFGLPLILHEQNSAPGLTNRWLGRLADLVMVGFPEALDGFAAKRKVLTGNPGRPEICAAGRARPQASADRPRILAVGGSQGAKALNEAVMSLAETLLARGVRFRLVHQTGPDMEREAAERYRRLGLEAEVKPFITDMAEAYRTADLAVSRAGALTLAELAAARLPAVLVPLPTAAGDHQTVNARSLAAKGLARLVPQAGIPGGALVETVEALLKDPGERDRMSALAAREVPDPDSVGPKMASLVAELLESRRRGAGPEGDGLSAG